MADDRKQQQFLRDIAAGDMGRVENWINAHPEWLLSTYNDSGTHPLQMAVLHGHDNIVRLLLSRRAAVDARWSNGETALMWASHDGQEEMVKFLLEAGAELEAVNAQGASAIMAAASGDQPSMVRWLRTQGADHNRIDELGYNSLMAAADEGRLDMVQLLIGLGARLDQQCLEKKDTALACAASEGHLAVVKLLLTAQADPYPQGEGGLTAVEQARIQGHEKVASILRSQLSFTLRSLLEATPRHSEKEITNDKLRGKEVAKNMCAEEKCRVGAERQQQQKNLEEEDSTARYSTAAAPCLPLPSVLLTIVIAYMY